MDKDKVLGLTLEQIAVCVQFWEESHGYPADKITVKYVDITEPSR